MNYFLVSLWLFLPAALANAAPVYSTKYDFWKSLNKPLDFGKKWQGKRILGDHKTIRGLMFGIFIGFITGALQFLLARNFDFFADLTKYINGGFFLYLMHGAVLAFGALFGDAIESFIKRRIGVDSGKPLLFADQIDYTIGAVLISMMFYQLSPGQYVAVILTWTLIHPVATTIAWLLKLKDSPI